MVEMKHKNSKSLWIRFYKIIMLYIIFLVYRFSVSIILGNINITNNKLDNKMIIYLLTPKRIIVNGREIYKDIY